MDPTLLLLHSQICTQPASCAPLQIGPQAPPDMIVRFLLLVHGVEGQPLHRQGFTVGWKLLEDGIGGLESLLVLLALVEFLEHQHVSFITADTCGKRQS